MWIEMKNHYDSSSAHKKKNRISKPKIYVYIENLNILKQIKNY